ncbi:MAG TPA: hypothetical protein VF162_10605 [Streptosporangiaceae bacterium]
MSIGSGPPARQALSQPDGVRPDARESSWQIAECLLPGITPETAEELGEQVRTELGRSVSPVSFIGSLLMPEDEVLLFLFAGPFAEVRTVSERAGLPFERILGCLLLGWTQPEPERGRSQ